MRDITKESNQAKTFFLSFFYFVGSKEPESFDNSVKQPFQSYHLNYGESPWEGELEGDVGDLGEYDEKEKKGEKTELEAGDNSNTKLVRQHLFFHVNTLP